MEGEDRRLTYSFEVGIVGAGVAGSTCAQVLGAAGVNVALFDHSHPREKPCGGIIEDRVVKEFSIPEKFLENKVKWLITERFGFRIKIPLKPPPFLVSRKTFDYYLLQRALKNKNVKFFKEKVNHVIRRKNEWVLKTNGNISVSVKTLIGADGCPSLIRKYVFKPIPPEFLASTVGYNFQYSSAYIEKAFTKNTIEVYYSSKYAPKMGFIWIFPKRTTINVGIGGFESGRRLKCSLDKFILSHPAGGRLRGLKRTFFTHLLPIIWTENFFDLPCSGDNWALIGDAAGHVNPVSGIGIYYAMKGGALCGLAFLNGDLRLFEKYWRNEYGDELYYGANIALKFYSNGYGLLLWTRYIIESLLY